MPKNGIGVTRTRMSKNVLLAAWVANIAKNLLGSLLPQPKQVPSRSGFQFLATGLQGKIARRKKVRPQMELKVISDMIARRARRY
jgi:hypothetical protein